MPDDLILANARLVLPKEIAVGNLPAGKGRVTAIGCEGLVRREVFERTGDYLHASLTKPHVESLKRHIRCAP